MKALGKYTGSKRDLSPYATGSQANISTIPGRSQNHLAALTRQAGRVTVSQLESGVSKLHGEFEYSQSWNQKRCPATYFSIPPRLLQTQAKIVIMLLAFSGIIFPPLIVCFGEFFFFFGGGAHHEALRDLLVSWPGIKPRSPALEAQGLNHWTTREVPGDLFP